MKFLKSKIFIAIIGIIFILFLLQFYFIARSYNRDTNSYVVLIEGKGASITSTSGGITPIFEIDKRFPINPGDKIKTLEDSMLIIEWGDRSITRLGGGSQIEISENDIDKDLKYIKISFRLLKGKSWSNVISIINKDSYFKQDIDGVVASVRGTVFEANYDNGYIVSHSHPVNIISGDTIELINPGEIFSLKSLSIENILDVLDINFEQINIKLDREYLEQLKSDFLSSLNDSNPLNLVDKLSMKTRLTDMLYETNPKDSIGKFISNLSPKKRDKADGYLEELAQELNFANPDDRELYNLKLNSREAVIDTTRDDDVKETLFRYSLYDLQDIIKMPNIPDDLLNNTLYFIKNTEEFIPSTKEEIIDMFNLDIDPNSLDFENVKGKIMDFNSRAESFINEWLFKLLDMINSF